MKTYSNHYAEIVNLHILRGSTLEARFSPLVINSALYFQIFSNFSFALFRQTTASVKQCNDNEIIKRRNEYFQCR
jgi:hypothetical protein